MDIRYINFEENGDYRGYLAVAEYGVNIPFEIKRVYYIYDTLPGVVRGRHSHKTLEQILVCVSGSCIIHLDDGCEKESILLDDPTKGLYIGPGVWRQMSDFSDNSILLVLASQIYDESDYIRDYNKFLEWIHNK